MIKGRCKIYVDDYKKLLNWPTEFVSVPVIGSYVKAINSDEMLKVSTVIHTTEIESYREEGLNGSRRTPLIILELTK